MHLTESDKLCLFKSRDEAKDALLCAIFEVALKADDIVGVSHEILEPELNAGIGFTAGSWIGQMCFFHSAGGITIGKNVGIGPGVKILTSSHGEEGIEVPILHSRVDFAPVTIGDDCDLGVGSILLPGVTLGRGVQVGAGAVVTGNLPDFAVAAGVPARILRIRSEVKTPG